MLPRIIQKWTLPLRRSIRHYQAKQYLDSLEHPILIYQMAKVGSRSVKEALEAADLSTVHIHFLTNLNEHLHTHVEKRIPIPNHFWVSSALQRRLDQQRWRIITLVRDPVSRALSGSFHSPELCGVDVSSYDRAWKTVIEEKLHNSDFEYPARWFEEELQQVFGVDVMAYPFNREEGYARIETERCDVLVCQMERLSTLIPSVISDFVGRQLSPTWTGVRTDSTYQAIKEDAYLPVEVLDRVYSSEYAKHFYSPKQIKDFRHRWRRYDDTVDRDVVDAAHPQTNLRQL